MPEKIPPHSKEAEQSVIGAGLMSYDALADVTEILKPKDFYDAAHREIYTVMLELFEEDKTVDIVTVANELKKRGSLEAAGGSAYIADLPNLVPITSNAKGYAQIVAEKSDLRELIAAADEIKASGYEEDIPAETILDHAEQRIFDISQGRHDDEFNMLGTVLDKNIDMIDTASKMKGSLLGITTGFRKLDEITKGLQKSDLIILAARAGMGKTAFALNLVRNAAKHGGANVIVFNLEMADTQLGMRLLSMESGVNMENLQMGKVTGEDWRNISSAIDNLTSANIVIDDNPGTTILQMKNKCRRMKKNMGLDLIVVDYLQLMDTGGKVESRQQEVSKLSRAFKLMARELDCPVLLLSQLSRETEKRSDHRPIPSDLRDSGSIEQDADIIIFLYRDEVYNKEESEDRGVCEVNIAKHRNGPTGFFKLSFLAECSRFGDITLEEPNI